MWFKGDLKTDGFEAQLFKDGKQIATTDNGGGVGTGERYYADKRGDDDSLFWREFTFAWPSRAEFIVTEDCEISPHIRTRCSSIRCPASTS